MTVTVKDISMHYAEYGEGLPLLLIHGWGVDHRLMSGCMESVFRSGSGFSGYRRIYVDLPGMGGTPGSGMIQGSDDLIEYMLDFIAAVIPRGPFLLAGESFGGYLARKLVRILPERIAGLLLVAPALRPWIKTERGFDRGDVPDHAVVFEDSAFMSRLTAEESDALRFMGVRLTEEVWERFRRDIWPGIQAADQGFLENQLARNPAFRDDPDTGMLPFSKPSLIVTARQDSVTGYRGIWSILENFPRASFAVLDGAGHNLQAERVPLFEALVRDWLERVRDDRDLAGEV